jgi:CheY-like chemotaxis protein
MVDILMPVMEGFERTILLRRMDRNVRIIAMTAAHERIGSYLDTAQKLGAVTALRKPFSQAELLAAVSEALDDGTANAYREKDSTWTRPVNLPS